MVGAEKRRHEKVALMKGAFSPASKHVEPRVLPGFCDLTVSGLLFSTLRRDVLFHQRLWP